MALLESKVTEGLRPAEATVELRDFNNRGHFLPVDRGLVKLEGDKYYLPVSVLHIDEKRQAALVALPVEADSGAHSIWVKLSQLRSPIESPA